MMAQQRPQVKIFRFPYLCWNPQTHGASTPVIASSGVHGETRKRPNNVVNNSLEHARLNFVTIRPERSSRYLIALTAVALLTLTGCTGGDAGDSDPAAPVSSPTAGVPVAPTSESSASTGSGPPKSGATTLVTAARTALAQMEGSTLISIETERNGAAWEVQLVTSDGTGQEMELSADGTHVVAGPVAKNEDVADKTRHLDRINAAKSDYGDAAQKILSAVPNGNITELDLDSEKGTTVWEADVVDESNVKHSVQTDAVTSEILKNSTS